VESRQGVADDAAGRGARHHGGGDGDRVAGAVHQAKGVGYRLELPAQVDVQALEVQQLAQVRRRDGGGALGGHWVRLAAAAISRHGSSYMVLTVPKWFRGPMNM